jgi:hypothetical protein
VGRLRDRVRSLVTGAPAADSELRAAVGTGVDAVVAAAADRAAERAAATWRAHPAGRGLLAGMTRMDAVSTELAGRTEAAVRAWQGHVFELVRDEGAGKRTTARLASLGVNGAGLTVMIAVFAHTGGLTGADGRGGRRYLGGRPAGARGDLRRSGRPLARGAGTRRSAHPRAGAAGRRARAF